MKLTKQTLYRLIQEAMEQPDVPELSPEEKRQKQAEKLAELFISGDASTIMQAASIADALDDFHVEIDVEEEAIEGMGTAVLVEVYFYDEYLYPVVREMYQQVRDPGNDQTPSTQQLEWFFEKGVEYKWMDEEQYFSAQFSPLERPFK